MLKPNRKSKYYYASHIHDAYLNTGYKYRGNIYKNTTSPELYNSNSNVTNSILLLESLIIYLIDYVKQIKLHFSIAHDKNDITIN